MDDKDKLIDQSPLAEDVAKNIKYDFLDYFLVKPLDPVKIKKEFSKPVSKGEATKDAEGIEAVDFDEVETEVKEVNSDYRRGIVLKRPLYYNGSDVIGTSSEIKVGDVVLFRDTAGLQFDLLKDSRLLRLYDIFGIEA
ncbi:hypothetical protein [Segatella bryantii]|uniref:hypothetical protein n=1 Tax=Segatella bryantii TaxID=77095 RepID=UPI00242CA446|nr:hypothetical protein [Segatella bryantii]